MSQYFLTAGGRKLGPYLAIMHPNGETEGDIRPILYDTAELTLLDAKKSYSLCFKEAASLGGKTISYVDVIDMETGLFFSLQVSNIYYFGVFDGVPHIIGRVGDSLVYFENFGKKQIAIEPDGDKQELTPLGAFDMFLTYDDNYYYPLIFSQEHKSIAKIEKFFDYYGYKSYIDSNWAEHFVLFIEDIRSTESAPYWYFVDNFQQISENVVLPSDQYVENWLLDPYGNIMFEITNGEKYHIDKSGKIAHWWENLPKSSNFSYTRVFEDTDADEVVAKNDFWYFIINRYTEKISKKEQEAIVYFKNFVWALSPEEANSTKPMFLMMKNDDQIVLVDANGTVVAGTDLLWDYEYKSANIHDGILEVITNAWKFQYFLA